MRPECWEVFFVLEAEDARDRETIDEVIEAFSCLVAGYEPRNLRLESKVLVTADSLPAFDHSPWRVVFLRREP